MEFFHAVFHGLLVGLSLGLSIRMLKEYGVTLNFLRNYLFNVASGVFKCAQKQSATFVIFRIFHAKPFTYSIQHGTIIHLINITKSTDFGKCCTDFGKMMPFQRFVARHSGAYHLGEISIQPHTTITLSNPLYPSIIPSIHLYIPANHLSSQLTIYHPR